MQVNAASAEPSFRSRDEATALSPATISRVDCLDGLRGIAALWVLLGHCVILSGWSLPIIDKPDLGVDLFMMLSGYLMVFQYRLRAKREPWSDPKTWMMFWTRRYFRIAPLYYVVLALCIAGGLAHADWTTSTPGLAFLPNFNISLANIVAHLTFIFSLIPKFGLNSPLPDWSLGLEMQFYAVFPALMLMTRKWGWTASVFLIALAAAVGTHATWHFAIRYPHPSLLAFKIDIFLAGMLLAECCRHGRRMAAFYLLLALALAMGPFQGEGSTLRMATREIMVLVFFSLVFHRSLPEPAGKWIGKLATVLGGNPFRWAGDVSYSVYLLHLPIMTAMAAILAPHYAQSVAIPVRCLMLFMMAAAVIYPLSWLTYSYVEIPGQAAGRRLLRRYSRNPSDALSEKADSLAAP